MVKVESIREIRNAASLKAIAIITIGERIRVADVKVVDGEKGIWVAMPSKAFEKDGGRRWSSTVEILDEKLKGEISEAVLTEFRKLDSQAPKAAATEW